MAYVSVDVDVDLEEFSDSELLDEVRDRGFTISSLEESTTLEEDLMVIYMLRRLGRPYDHLMDAYIYKHLGRIS